MSYKPDGYPDLSPYLMVRDVQDALCFVESAFAATRLRVFHDARGGIVHAEARIGDSVVMMGKTPDARPAHMHLFLPNPDAALERAVAAGATRTQAMIETADGARRGAVRDPQGTTWWLARQREERA